jgi:hypothetical protein
MTVALMLVACGGGGNPRPDGGMMMGTDGGMMMGTDGGMMMGTDSGRPDSGGMRSDGGMSSDPCASDVMGMPDRVGCNGYASGDPMPNGPLGTCTLAADPMMNPAGSCTGMNMICGAPMGASMGICYVTCPPASTYISTGGCPTGFRCFTLDREGGLAICFRDCDGMHPCPSGFRCDPEGSCV